MHAFLPKNAPSLRNYRTALRRNPTEPEQLLWRRLQRKQLNVRFRRQFSVGSFILDFYTPSIGLAIELDGDSHYASRTAQHRDDDRDECLARDGIIVLRFTNVEVMAQLDGVCERIRLFVHESISHPL